MGKILPCVPIVKLELLHLALFSLSSRIYDLLNQHSNYSFYAFIHLAGNFHVTSCIGLLFLEILNWLRQMDKASPSHSQDQMLALQKQSGLILLTLASYTNAYSFVLEALSSAKHIYFL